jgi:hypothetical protein
MTATVLEEPREVGHQRRRYGQADSYLHSNATTIPIG